MMLDERQEVEGKVGMQNNGEGEGEGKEEDGGSFARKKLGEPGWSRAKERVERVWAQGGERVHPPGSPPIRMQLLMWEEKSGEEKTVHTIIHTQDSTRRAALVGTRDTREKGRRERGRCVWDVNKKGSTLFHKEG